MITHACCFGSCSSSRTSTSNVSIIGNNQLCARMHKVLPKLLELFFFIFVIHITESNAATLYMGNNEVYTNLQDAISAMHSGDSLIIRDGVYSGAKNTIDSSHTPPNGNNVNYTRIIAENIGKVIFDGQGSHNLVTMDDSSFIIFEGLIFKNAQDNIISITHSDHIKILKCGLSEAGSDASSVSGDPLFFRYNSYCLIEDTYIWGNGRYHFYILDSDYVILRRCVNRYDRGTSVGYSNQGSFRLYGTSNSLLQNCISIDGDQENQILTFSDETVVEAGPKTIWIGPNGSSGKGGRYNEINGCISLNTGKSLVGFVGNSQSSGNVFRNSVFWKSKNALWTRSSDISDKILIDHSTFGAISDAYGYHDRAVESDVLGGAEVKNSIIYGTGDVAFRNVISNYNDLFGNQSNYAGGSVGLNDYCIENSNQIDPFANSLKYIPYIMTNSHLAGKASDNGDIGANILTKIGVSGTLYGEDGYNIDTGESLWPFPYEDLIKNQMSQYMYTNTIGTINGVRGFAASGSGLNGKPITLTSYIFEYLGNACPDHICNYPTSPRTPAKPTGLSIH